MRNASSTAFSSFVIVVLIINILLSALSGRPCRVCSRRRLRKIFSAACPVCSGLQLQPTTNRNAMQLANLELRCFSYNFCK
nr:MAG TPA: hypothetical protein [Caudoviricetes sp.]